MARRIVQIATHYEPGVEDGELPSCRLFALCDDGSVFELPFGEFVDFKQRWLPVRPIPQGVFPSVSAWADPMASGEDAVGDEADDA